MSPFMCNSMRGHVSTKTNCMTIHYQSYVDQKYRIKRIHVEKRGIGELFYYRIVL